MTTSRRAALFDLDGVLLDSAAAVRSILAAVATCALGRRVTPGDLPPGALRRPRCEVLAPWTSPIPTTRATAGGTAPCRLTR
ncbi:hypothetical protein [Streptomyces sp. NPDC003247]|uniref:hypothetical protein n=1 Tax=Streptomyces sp. NPDC003247 TaxID=3364677 RepID=UPI0036AAC326